MDFVQVSEEEGDEPIELPAEEDGTLLLSTLQAQFPGSCGLKYRNLDTKAVRGVRSNEGRFFPPSVDSGWGEYVYFCVFPKGKIAANLEKVYFLIHRCPHPIRKQAEERRQPGELNGQDQTHRNQAAVHRSHCARIALEDQRGQLKGVL